MATKTRPPVNGRRPRTPTARAAPPGAGERVGLTPAGRPATAVPRLLMQTFGTPAILAVADYPAGTPCDLAGIVPDQHARAFATVFAGLYARTDDLTDATFYALMPAETGHGLAWSSHPLDELRLPDMLDRLAGHPVTTREG